MIQLSIPLRSNQASFYVGGDGTLYRGLSERSETIKSLELCINRNVKLFQNSRSILIDKLFVATLVPEKGIITLKSLDEIEGIFFSLNKCPLFSWENNGRHGEFYKLS